MVRDFGARLEPLVRKKEGQLPGLGAVADVLKRLDQALGLDSYAALKDRNVGSFLALLDKHLFASLLKVERFRQRIEATEVKLVAEKGDWAELRFSSKKPNGDSTDDKVEVVRLEGTWVPVGWTVDWPKQMAEFRGLLEKAAELKKERPGIVKEKLAEISAFLNDPVPIADEMFQRLGIVKD
jgi:hypothetical protein